MLRTHANRTDVSAETANNAINVAQARVARAARWPELEREVTFAVAEGDGSVEFSVLETEARVRELYTVRFGDRRLTYIPTREWDETEETFTSGGRRTNWYTVWNRSLRFRPAADVAYSAKARFLIWPVDLSDDAQESQLAEKDDIIVSFATAQLFRELGNGEASGEWDGNGNGQLRIAIRNLERVSDLSPSPVWATGERYVANNYWVDPFVRRIYT